LSLHPRFEINEDAGVVIETEAPTTSQILDTGDTGDDLHSSEEERTEPDLDVYADSLLLVDALERHEGFR